MSPHLDDYCDALTQETLVEMAENFFGERKSLDDEKERFEHQAGILRTYGESVLLKASLLHALLLNEENVHEFFGILGVQPGRLLLLVDPAKARLFLPLPAGFSCKRRYVKLVLRTYEAVADGFDIYLNGRYYNLAGSKQKRLSVHYKLLKDWCGHINRRIRKVNEGLAPSCVLGFAHGLDVEALDRERISGATLENYACSLDESLAMTPVSCHEAGLVELPQLPPLDKVKHPVKQYAKALYSANKTQCKALLTSLRQTACPLDSRPPHR